ncbi:ABC transporter ATP-binding protein [Segeticoccus rhizosphaerae]|uniref:ABC transporter ATP-binding protein n=1 Tax=Segeticoccus rhizosphaerae TaxID=1104777 RepID=UPI0010BF99E1|nr:ABC transporter ATP-binding protein [Ornithinicoccus soli]
MNDTRGRVGFYDVSVAYDGAAVIQGLSLDVVPGELVTVLGPSGCGKTTLLLALAGLLPISGGSITVDGRRATVPGPDRAMVFQDLDQLLPWKTVQKNVEFGAKHGWASSGKASGVGRQKDVRELLSMVGLSQVSGRYPVHLSGGMRQRVAIARALAADPDVLLMDEPFSALDAQTREQLQLELLSIWRRAGKTIIFITHSIDEAAILGSRILVMGRNGRVMEDFINSAVPTGDQARDIAARAEVQVHLRAALDSCFSEATPPAYASSSPPAGAWNVSREPE